MPQRAPIQVCEELTATHFIPDLHGALEHTPGECEGELGATHRAYGAADACRADARDEDPRIVRRLAALLKPPPGKAPGDGSGRSVLSYVLAFGQ